MPVGREKRSEGGKRRKRRWLIKHYPRRLAQAGDNLGRREFLRRTYMQACAEELHDKLSQQ